MQPPRPGEFTHECVMASVALRQTRRTSIALDNVIFSNAEISFRDFNARLRAFAANAFLERTRTLTCL